MKTLRNQPSLPFNLDEAAQCYYEDKMMESERVHTDDIPRAFKAGAEWMAAQGGGNVELWKRVDSNNYPVPDKKKIYIVYTKEHYHLVKVINHPKDDNLYQWRCIEFPNRCYDMCEGDMYFKISL